MKYARVGEERRREKEVCDILKLRAKLTIDKIFEGKFVKKKWVPRKWSTSIGFGMEPILGFLREVEVEVEATFHHTKDTKW